MKKFLKYLFGILLLLIVLAVIYLRFVVHESAPETVQGQDATAKAEQMLAAVNKPAWDQLKYVSWSFRGEHDYVWDRVNNDAIVKWGDNEVHLDPDEITGKVFKGDQEVAVEESNDAIQTAWSYWCNDMFWLSAPFKLKDPGVNLSIAKDGDGQEGLLVQYSSGGVTPGDSYLWYTDENGLPTGYKMWADIIPIGGVYTSWEKWETVEGGAKIATFHKGGPLEIPITNLKAGDSWQDLGYSSSPIKL